MTLSLGTSQGGWQKDGNYRDGKYYIHERHLKMNSSSGAATGVFENFIDNRYQTSEPNLPWIKSGDTIVGWNMVV